MKKTKKTKKPTYIIFVVVFLLILQTIITYGFTNTKQFSYRALIRNLSFVIPIVYGIQYIWIPILLEVAIEVFKYYGYHIDKYISTTYLYNDYLFEISKQYPILTNYSEGNYDGLIGFDTKDLSQENLKRVRDWGQKTYYECLNNPSPYIKDIHGKNHGIELKYETENRKFEYICKKCNIQKGMKILEIGFGECDFLKYIHKNYGIRPVGVSIAKEQVENARSLGFEAHCLNSWEITPEIGTYDLVIQCGNLEYVLLFGESNEKYKDYCNIIKNVLNPAGKYFVTACHINDRHDFSYIDLMKGYILWAGNDGLYPTGKDGYTKYAKQVGFNVLYQEDRTLDYYINELLYFSHLRCTKTCHTVVEPWSLSKALFLTIAAPYYIHSYFCYQPSKYLPMVPFAWEFEPQYNSNTQKWDIPFTLQYILLQK